MKTIVTLLVILPYCSSAQGLFITGDQSATTIQAAYATDIEASFATNQPSVSTQGIEIGHSMGGTFDVGLRLGRDRLDSYYNTIFYGLSTSLYLLKPDSLDGAIVSLDGAYTRLNMKVENFFYNGTWWPGNLHENAFEFAGTAGSRIQASPMLTLVPLVTLGARNTSNELESESNFFYGFGLSWIVQTGNLTRFVITPSVSVRNSISTVGLKGGFVFLQ